jgi:LysM repeat protein
LDNKSKINPSAVAMCVFFVLAINLSLVLSGISKTFYAGFLADANVIVEAMDLKEPIEDDMPTSMNDVNIDSYDYYQNLNMEAKSEDFLDLYLIEDKNFLLRTINVSELGGDLTKPDRIITYVVKSGDSLGKIAKQYDINIETIRTANSLKKNTISPGQELVILPISGIYYTVKKGDTLGKLAIKYKISASVIREYNNLDGDSLKINDKIILPGAKEQIIVSNTSIAQGVKITETSASNSNFFIYPTVG